MNRKNATLLILIFATLVAFVVTSCEGNVQVSTQSNSDRMELDNTSEYYNQQYRVFTLEGCEYIKVDVGNTTWGSHKGNCKNPIHKNIQNGSN